MLLTFHYITRQLFDKIPQRTSSSKLLFHTNHNPHHTLNSFHHTNNRLTLPNNKFTLCTLLTSCTKALNHHLGTLIHSRIIQSGLHSNIILNTKLIDFYAKCGMLADARKVFITMKEHDYVSWTSIISGFSQNGHGREAVLLFKQMLRKGIRPNCVTFASVVSACQGFEEGASVHALVMKVGCEWNNYAVSALIDCYSKCGEIDQAVFLYRGVGLERDVIVFNSMIAAYSHNLCGEEALELFVEMWGSGLCPTEYTFSSVSNACAGLTLLQNGRQVHCLMMKFGYERSVFVASSLIDMYAKCGNIDEARCIFDEVDRRNSVLWTSMITGYAHCGRGEEGLELFEQLIKVDGTRPDHVCFTAVLTACNHAGFVDRATNYFDKMGGDYGLTPEIDQYACMVDLYGKTGLLMKAKKMIEQMPFEPNVVMLSSFLASCRVHGEINLGRMAAYQLFKMDPYSAAHYVGLANIYAEAGMWENVLQVRKMMRAKGVRKSTGWSWTEVEKQVHVFSVSDTSHPQLQCIYAELDKLTLEMMEAGYMPPTTYVSEDNTNEVSAKSTGD